MKIYWTTLLLLGLASLAGGFEDPRESPALEPLHFRIEALTDALHTATGWIEASEEDGREYDRALLDTNGDGKPDQTIDLEKGRATGSAG